MSDVIFTATVKQMIVNNEDISSILHSADIELEPGIEVALVESTVSGLSISNDQTTKVGKMKFKIINSTPGKNLLNFFKDVRNLGKIAVKIITQSDDIHYLRNASVTNPLPTSFGKDGTVSIELSGSPIITQ